MPMVRMFPRFKRLGIVLKPNQSENERLGFLNPACTRLRDGTLQLYPRMVAAGGVSSIGSFRVDEYPDGMLIAEQCGFALEPAAPYELRDQPGAYGCEDPRVTFIPAINRYVMAYVAFGPRGPEVALAVSRDGLVWERLGLMHFPDSDAPFADKDAAFFPEPLRSPAGVPSLAFYQRPTLQVSVLQDQQAAAGLKALPPGATGKYFDRLRSSGRREGIDSESSHGHGNSSSYVAARRLGQHQGGSRSAAGTDT